MTEAAVMLYIKKHGTSCKYIDLAEENRSGKVIVSSPERREEGQRS